MTNKQAYRELDLPAGATLAQVELSYRDMVRAWHPDRFGSDAALRKRAEAKLKRINLAYEVLKSGRQVTGERYADENCTYHGGDPRLAEVRSGRPVAVMVSAEGVSVRAQAAPREQVSYPTDSVLQVASQNCVWLATGREEPKGGIPSRGDELWLLTRDPEGIAQPFVVRVRFRNEYFAQVYSKRAVALLALRDARTVAEERRRSGPPSPTGMGSGMAQALAVVILVTLVCALVAALPKPPQQETLELRHRLDNSAPPSAQPLVQDNTRQAVLPVVKAQSIKPVAKPAIKPVLGTIQLSERSHSISFSVTEGGSLRPGELTKFSGTWKESAASGRPAGALELTFWPSDMRTMDRGMRTMLGTSRYFGSDQVRVSLNDIPLGTSSFSGFVPATVAVQKTEASSSASATVASTGQRLRLTFAVRLPGNDAPEYLTMEVQAKAK